MSKWPGTSKSIKTPFGGLSRSALMSRIHSSGNKTTELRMVVLLRQAGLKGWRRHANLFGKPDFIWPSAKVAGFVDGCYWHGHGCCSRNLTPKRNAAIWQNKINKNKKRDKKVTLELKKQGWKVVRIWECQLIKQPTASIKRVKKAINLNFSRRLSTTPFIAHNPNLLSKQL